MGIYMCVFVCIYNNTYIYIYVCVCVYIYTHINIYIHRMALFVVTYPE